MSDAFGEELSRMGAMQLLQDGQPKQAAIAAYQWLLKETLPPVGEGSGQHENGVSNLYNMLSYLLDRGTTLGFSYESKVVKDSLIFVVTNDNNKKLQERRDISIFLETLLASICEQQLFNLESEVTQSENNNIVVKIKLP
jgi:hypothetical protein